MVCVNDQESEILEPIFLHSEKLAGGAEQRGQKSLRQLMEEARADEILKAAIEGPYVRDRSKNIVKNNAAQILRYTAQYSICDDQLEKRLDEMVDTCGRGSTHSHMLTSPTNLGSRCAACYKTVADS